ncbi:MAG: hypothetical protein HOP03_03690 [Lysobacter sp.]|nr:hypothetical protein [Lysobacter sp.]
MGDVHPLQFGNNIFRALEGRVIEQMLEIEMEIIDVDPTAIDGADAA